MFTTLRAIRRRAINPYSTQHFNMLRYSFCHQLLKAHMRSLLLLMCIASGVLASGQTIQLGLEESADGVLEFKLLSDADFDQFFSSTVVTVRWATTAGVTVGTTPTNLLPNAFTTAGVVLFNSSTTDSIFSYLTFTTLGVGPLGATNAWTAGNEVSFFSIPYSNTSDTCVTFEILYDQYQLDQNLGWYVSLNGENRTNGFILGKEQVIAEPDPSCRYRGLFGCQWKREHHRCRCTRLNLHHL